MVPFPAISKKAKDKLIFGTLIFTLLVIIWGLFYHFVRGTSFGDSRLILRFYDVGQGDSILITEGETQILVDGGPGDDVLSYLGQDMPPWDRTIELMVLTHPHADHLAGLVSVLDRYRVARVLFYPTNHDSKIYQRFLEAVEDEEATILAGVSGTVLELSGINLQVLWPQSGYSDTNVNNCSVVLLLKYGKFDALLLGDAEKDIQVRLLPITSEVEVLKVAHQGAWDGAYGPLLKQASPELAVISVGAGNRYGHPHQATLDLLDQLGIVTRRTDLSGTIKVMSDGEDFWYTTEK